jgi:hypothetical protein
MTQLLVLTSARRTDDPWAYLTKTVEQIEAEEIDIPKGIVVDGRYKGPALPAGWSVTEFLERELDAGAVDMAGFDDTGINVMAKLQELVVPKEVRQRQKLWQGNKDPYWFLLGKALATGDDVIVLEDDLLLCRNAIRRMVAQPIPSDLAWIQYFSPRIFQTAWAAAGLWRPPPYSHSFLQAVKYSRRALATIASWRDDPEFGKFSSSDDTLNLCAMRNGLHYGAHYPDLVQHVGESTNCDPNIEPGKIDGWRTSKCWPGPKFDALSLFQRDDVYR